MQSERKGVLLPKDELFEMLDIADEMVRFCSWNMPAEQYYRAANAIWVIAHRAAKSHEQANELKTAMLDRRAGRAALGEKEG